MIVLLADDQWNYFISIHLRMVIQRVHVTCLINWLDTVYCIKEWFDILDLERLFAHRRLPLYYIEGSLATILMKFMSVNVIIFRFHSFVQFCQYCLKSLLTCGKVRLSRRWFQSQSLRSPYLFSHKKLFIICLLLNIWLLFARVNLSSECVQVCILLIIIKWNWSDLHLFYHSEFKSILNYVTIHYVVRHRHVKR